MQTLPLRELWILRVALLSIGLGTWVSRRVTLVHHGAARGAAPALAQREGALAVGGFMGFSLGAMPVGLSAMQRLSLQAGAAPRAFLVVTLAASLVQDLINAGVVQGALSWAAP